MEMQHDTKLTSSEIACLWTSFQNGTMGICGVQPFLTNVEDPDIRPILEYSRDTSQQHVQRVKELFQTENYPIPVGFTEHDVNLGAPRLFSDKLYLMYMISMGEFGLSTYSQALSLVAREDIVNFYTDCLEESIKLINWARKVAIQKGIYVHSPHLPTPEQVDFVKKQNFLAGGWLSEKRPLLGMEAANLVYNAKRNAVGQAVSTGFSQVVSNKEIRRFFERGREMAGKHMEVFSSSLHENYLSSMNNLTSEVSDSTISPYSDKLMMFHVTQLIGSSIGAYGIAMSSAMRRDLGVNYGRLLTEVAKYSEDGAKIMIDNGWMEQPPEAADRKELARKE